jgi:Lon protease-like protein
MPEPLLSLFPLGVVLLPGTPLPLHIFEERYKEMINEAIANGTEFGIVQAAEKGIMNIGCTATVEEVVKRYPEGELDIVVMGRRRFEIILLDQEKEYLRAAVSFFDDEDAAEPPHELRLMALAGLMALREAQESSKRANPDHADPQLSFKVAYFVGDLTLRQMLLSIRSETERLKQLSDFLPEYVARTRRTMHVRKVAPLNGHGFMTLGTED